MTEQTPVKICRKIIQIDPTRYASANGDGTIDIWNAETHKKIISLDAHIGMVASLAVLPGKRMASCGSDKTVVIWNTETFKPIAMFGDHVGPVWELIYVASNRKLLSCDPFKICSMSVDDFNDRKLVVCDEFDVQSLLQVNNVLSTDSLWAADIRKQIVKEIASNNKHVNHEKVSQIVKTEDGHFSIVDEENGKIYRMKDNRRVNLVDNLKGKNNGRLLIQMLPNDRFIAVYNNKLTIRYGPSLLPMKEIPLSESPHEVCAIGLVNSNTLVVARYDGSMETYGNI